MPEDDVLNRDLADAQSEEENSDYDNNVDESGDETPFLREDGDEEDEKEGPDLSRDMPDVEALTRDFHEIRTAMWDECRPTWEREKQLKKEVVELKAKLKEVEEEKNKLLEQFKWLKQRIMGGSD
ncbi:uncharacterized protein [Nicotiana sylvestris]|uniref:uncharacterized protein n=1 Tax=Nicotiana sylvestris TaxID=4096 RepID=UPI00388C9C2F